MGIKPPPLDILGNFIEKILKTITKVLKIGSFSIPSLPRLDGIEMGFTIGEKLGFKFQIKSFSMSCVIRTKGGFAVSCKLGLDFLSIFKDIGKWIGKMGKKLLDATGKAFMAIGDALGDFAGDIAEGAKKVFTGIVDVAKKAYEGAKKAVTFLHDKTKKALGNIKKAHDKAVKAVSKAVDDCKKAFESIGRALDGAINALGNA